MNWNKRTEMRWWFLLFVSIGGANSEIPMESLRKHLPDSTNQGKFAFWQDGRQDSVDPDLQLSTTGTKFFSVNCYFLCLRNVLRIWNLVCFACKYKASLYYLEYLFEVSAPPAPPRARQRTGESQPGLKTLFWWEISRENKRIHCVFCICIVLTVRSQWFQMAYYTNSSNY